MCLSEYKELADCGLIYLLIRIRIRWGYCNKLQSCTHKPSFQEALIVSAHPGICCGLFAFLSISHCRNSFPTVTPCLPLSDNATYNMAPPKSYLGASTDLCRYSHKAVRGTFRDESPTGVDNWWSVMMQTQSAKLMKKVIEYKYAPKETRLQRNCLLLLFDDIYLKSYLLCLATQKHEVPLTLGRLYALPMVWSIAHRLLLQTCNNTRRYYSQCLTLHTENWNSRTYQARSLLPLHHPHLSHCNLPVSSWVTVFFFPLTFQNSCLAFPISLFLYILGYTAKIILQQPAIIKIYENLTVAHVSFVFGQTLGSSWTRFIPRLAICNSCNTLRLHFAISELVLEISQRKMNSPHAY